MIANADAARIPLPDKSVHCVPTSPPYYGPRRYKGKQERDWPAVSYSPMPGLPPLEVPAMRCELGREKTPEAYTAHLVLCFREVFRVLRDDGVCWIVEGDSYASEGGVHKFGSYDKGTGRKFNGGRAESVLSAGNLLAIPYRLLLALQADGWLVRNDVVWSKVAPMPESVAGTRFERHRIRVAKSARANPNSSHALSQQGANNAQGARDGVNFADHSDEYTDCPSCPKCSATGGYVLRRGSWRHTRSHETVLMLAKGMQYFSDQERVRERLACPDAADGSRIFGGNNKNGANAGHGERTEGRAYESQPAGRNPRDVLTPAPSPFKGEHYAAFPSDLIRQLILSSAPLKCCPVCGAGWAAVVERGKAAQTNPRPFSKSGNDDRNDTLRIYEESESSVIGHLPTCQCNAAGWQPGLVLDPFAGSGTTGMVCRELGLRFVGLDISGEYLRDIALVRSERLTPDSAMVNLPLFELLHS